MKKIHKTQNGHILEDSLKHTVCSYAVEDTEYGKVLNIWVAVEKEQQGIELLDKPIPSDMPYVEQEYCTKADMLAQIWECISLSELGAGFRLNLYFDVPDESKAQQDMLNAAKEIYTGTKAMFEEYTPWLVVHGSKGLKKYKDVFTQASGMACKHGNDGFPEYKFKFILGRVWQKEMEEVNDFVKETGLYFNHYRISIPVTKDTKISAEEIKKNIYDNAAGRYSESCTMELRPIYSALALSDGTYSVIPNFDIRKAERELQEATVKVAIAQPIVLAGRKYTAVNPIIVLLAEDKIAELEEAVRNMFEAYKELLAEHTEADVALYLSAIQHVEEILEKFETFGLKNPFDWQSKLQKLAEWMKEDEMPDVVQEGLLKEYTAWLLDGLVPEYLVKSEE